MSREFVKVVESKVAKDIAKVTGAFSRGEHKLKPKPQIMVLAFLPNNDIFFVQAARKIEENQFKNTGDLSALRKPGLFVQFVASKFKTVMKNEQQ